MQRFFLATTITCLLFSLTSYAQKDKGYLSLTAGPSFATGDYAGTDLSNSKAGFAKTGEAINITYNKLISKKIGFAISLNGQRNAVNTKAMESSFSDVSFSQGFIAFTGDVPPNTPPATGQSVKYHDWKFEKKSWLAGTFLVGGYGEFPLSQNNKMAFITKIMVGLVYAKSPVLKGSGSTDSSVATIQQSSGTAFGFAYLVNGGLKYQLSNKLSLLAGLDFSGTSKIKFKNINETFTSQTNSTNLGGSFSSFQSSATGNSYQTIQAFNFTIGLGIKL